MSEVIDTAVAKLNEKLGSSGFDGSAKFVIEEEGAIILDGSGARAGDDATDVTMTADTETFRSILDGTLDPTSAFMSGRLKIDGDIGAAMRLGSALA